MPKTVNDLKSLRKELIERRRMEVYRISGKHDNDQLAEVSRLQIAIEAVESVIAEGIDQAAPQPSTIEFLE